jgi:hypothetical protein
MVAECCSSLNVCVGALATSIASLIGLIIFYVKTTLTQHQLKEQLNFLVKKRKKK